ERGSASVAHSGDASPGDELHRMPSPAFGATNRVTQATAPGALRLDFCGISTRKRLPFGGLFVVLVFLLAGEDLLGDQAGVLTDRGLDLGGDIGIVLQEGLGVLAALPDALAVIGEPGARLLDHTGLDAEVDDLAILRDALAVHDVELDLLERRRELVLDHLDAGLVAGDL